MMATALTSCIIRALVMQISGGTCSPSRSCEDRSNLSAEEIEFSITLKSAGSFGAYVLQLRDEFTEYRGGC